MNKSSALIICLLLVLSPAMLATENDPADIDADDAVVADDSTLSDGGMLEELGIEKRGLQPRLGNRADTQDRHGHGHDLGHEHGNGHGEGHSHGNDEDGDDEDDDEDGDETPISN